MNIQQLKFDKFEQKLDGYFIMGQCTIIYSSIVPSIINSYEYKSSLIILVEDFINGLFKHTRFSWY